MANRLLTCRRGDDVKVQALPATGHSYDAGKVTTEPAIGKAGVRTYTCAACGAIEPKASGAGCTCSTHARSYGNPCRHSRTCPGSNGYTRGHNRPGASHSRTHCGSYGTADGGL